MHPSTRPIPYPEPPLAGAAFVLRPFREDDFDAALELEQDAAAARWVPALPAADGAGVVAFYDECRREGSLLHLVIADRASDAYLGETMLALGEHGVGEVGCCLVPAARGRGIATEVLRTAHGLGVRGARPRPRAGVRRPRERPGAPARGERGLPT